MNALLEDAVLTFARQHGYYLSVFISKRRTTHLSASRHSCWYFLKNHLGFSYQEIADVFDADVTSIRHALLYKHKRKQTYESIRDASCPKPVPDEGGHAVQTSHNR